MTDPEKDLSPALGGREHDTGREPAIGGERAAKAALAGLTDDDWQVRVRAAQELIRRGDDTAIRELVQALNDWNGTVRKEAAKALVRIGAEAVPSLLGCLESADDVTGRAVIGVLAGIGAPALPALIEVLGRSDYRMQSDVIQAMGVIKHKDAIPYLVEALGSQGTQVRYAAVRALHQFGEQAAPALVGALDSDNAHTRGSACDLLGRAHYQPAVPRLITLLDDPQHSVWRNAVQALGEIDTQQALDALLKQMESPDEERRDSAVHALGNLKRPASIAALMDAAADDPSLDVRSHAVEQLGRLMAVEAIPLLGERLHKETDRGIRDSILRALGDIDHPDAVPFVYSVVGEPNQLGAIAYEMLHMLSGTGHPLCRQFYTDELHSEYVRRRTLAIETLAEIDNPGCVLDLIALLNEESQNLHAAPDSRSEGLLVCDIVVHTLEQIGTLEALQAVQSWREREQANMNQGDNPNAGA